MTQQPLEVDKPLDIELGDIGLHETWWVERQEALERTGYLLRPRYHPGWKPSWAGTGKLCFDFEDGLMQRVGYDTSATGGLRL